MKFWATFCMIVGLVNVILFALFHDTSCLWVAFLCLAVGYIGLHE